MLTGDAGFERRRGKRGESMSSRWERTLSWATLIDVPHHGGTYGSFGARLRAGLSSLSRPRPLHLDLSVADPNTRAPPHDGFQELLPYLAGPGRPVTLRMSALPRDAALGAPLRGDVTPAGRSAGSARVELCQCPGGWGERGAPCALTLHVKPPTALF